MAKAIKDEQKGREIEKQESESTEIQRGKEK